MTAANALDPVFLRALENGLRYWRARTADGSDAALHELDAERSNLLRIVQVGLALPETWGETAVVARQTFLLVERRGYWREWTPILERLTACLPETQPDLLLPLLNQLGQLYRLSSALPQAVAAHRRAAALAQQRGDAFALAEAQYNLSEDLLETHAYDEAAAAGRAALRGWASLADADRWVAATLTALGKVARATGDYEASAEMLLQAVEIRRQLALPLPLVRALNDLAVTCKHQGAYARALAYLQEAAAILAPTAYELDKAMLQLNIGSLAFQQADWPAAKAAFRQADSSYLRESGHLRYQAVAANNLGNVLLKQALYADAEAYLQRAQRLWQQLENRLELANTVGTLGELYVAQGRAQPALAALDEAISLLEAYPHNAWARKLLASFQALRQTAMQL